MPSIICTLGSCSMRRNLRGGVLLFSVCVCVIRPLCWSYSDWFVIALTCWSVFPGLFSFRRDMPWHAVWLPFHIQSYWVCVCVSQLSGLYAANTHTHRSPRCVCLLNVGPPQQGGISWWYPWKCWLSHSLSPTCPFVCFFSTVIITPHTHTCSHTVGITVSDVAFLGSLSHCRSNESMQCSCTHQLLAFTYFCVGDFPAIKRHNTIKTPLDGYSAAV